MHTMNIRLPEEFYEKLKDAAAQRGISINALINNIIYEYFNKR